MVDVAKLNQPSQIAEDSAGNDSKLPAGQTDFSSLAVHGILPKDHLARLVAQMQSPITKIANQLKVQSFAVGGLQDILRNIELSGASKLAREMSGVMGASKHIDSLARMGQAAHLSNFHAVQFQRIDASVLAKVVDSYNFGLKAKVLSHDGLFKKEVLNAMSSMRTPWVDMHNSMRSISGFIELQAIGKTLANKATYTQKVSSILRHELGDWRDKITWSNTVLAQSDGRSAFYVKMGFDNSLTAFPPAAFSQAIKLVGIRQAPPRSIPTYGEQTEIDQIDIEEQDYVRSNKAHDRLFRLETRLRRFIDKKMSNTFSKNWPKHQLPNGVYEKWFEKRRTAINSGCIEKPLIAYADFTDYAILICRKDNWEQVFRIVFKRQESVRETFNRLYPVRHATMHARAITQDDELYLYAEERRLYSAIEDYLIHPVPPTVT